MGEGKASRRESSCSGLGESGEGPVTPSSWAQVETWDSGQVSPVMLIGLLSYTPITGPATHMHTKGHRLWGRQQGTLICKNIIPTLLRTQSRPKDRTRQSEFTKGLLSGQGAGSQDPGGVARTWRLVTGRRQFDNGPEAQEKTC
ncbi:hypothetical protein NQZ68_029812 [Dissostichus eleginoides]|nr:hypothetical protein NQZ68_029812 [Dissostichus eleginoides]